MLESDGFLVLGAAESVVGISDAFKPYPERRGLYCPNAARTARPGLVSGMVQPIKAVASAPR
jgi:chemotaxis protein methyltransferase CheR